LELVPHNWSYLVHLYTLEVDRQQMQILLLQERFLLSGVYDASVPLFYT
jgi:hypothetical protein